MRHIWIISLSLILVLFLLVAGVSPALAQGGQPSTTAQNLTFFTRYPAQEVAIGETVTFKLTLRAESTPQIVQLNLEDLPEGWAANFRGDGRIIEAAYVEPENDTTVDLRVEPPADAAPGAHRFAVIAQSPRGQVELPIELIVKEKLPPNLELDVELPTLRGTPSTTFRYNADLKNEGDEDLAVNLMADAPPGFLVSFKLSGQEVTTVPLAANESKRVNVEVKMFPETPAGTYQIDLLAQGDETEAVTSLMAEVIGQPELTVSAPDGRLSGEAYVGDTTPLKLIIQNNGSAPAHNIELSASQPTGWKVDFEPKQIAEIGAGKQVEVTANVQPAEQAVAGDYVVTLRARPEEGATESAEFRITVLTSTMWGMVGVGLIAVAVIVVGLAVMRFGRR